MLNDSFPFPTSTLQPKPAARRSAGHTGSSWEHLIKVKAIHEEDWKNGFGTVYLPYAIEKKYPNAKITINKQHKLGSHEEQPLLFSLVHLILC